MPPTAATKNSAPAAARRPRCGRRGRPPAGWPGRRRGPGCAVATAAAGGARAERGPGPRPAGDGDPGARAPPRCRGRRPCGPPASAVRDRARPASPSSRISKMPTSPVGPKRCLTEVRTRSVWWRSPSKESTVSTRCSTARGPARSPSLVTWPTRSSGTPLDFAMRVRRSTQARTWARLPAGLGQLGVGDGLERVDDHERRVVPLDGRLDLLDVGPLEREEVAGHQADARRPPTHLRERLLGRGEHDVDPRRRHRREHLEEQRRLADARRPEQQGDRARDHARRP